MPPELLAGLSQGLLTDPVLDQPPMEVETVDGAAGGEAPDMTDLPMVPIVLGVIGHREIPRGHREAISTQFRTLFEQIRDVDPGTPLILMTGLAEGADQLAAEAALASGASVRAILPFPPDIYRLSTSFQCGEAGDEARTVFDRLLRDPRVDWYVAPLPEDFARTGVGLLKGPAGEGTRPATCENIAPPMVDWLKVAADRHDPKSKRLRYACYANVGGYIVRRCHALIAVWDGLAENPDHPSGTAEHVNFKLVGKSPSDYPWADAEPLGFRGERGLVLSIHSPKTLETSDPSKPRVGDLTILMPGEPQVPGSAETTKAPIAWNVLLSRKVSDWSRFRARLRRSLGLKPSAKAKAQAELTQFREICQSVRDFNRDVSEEQVAHKIRKRLLKNAASHDIPVFGPLERRWYQGFSRFREASAEVSNQLQLKLIAMQIGLFALIGLSGIAFHFYAHWFNYDREMGHTKHQWGWLVLFSVSIGLAMALVAWNWWTRLDQRRLDARAFGEGLRVRRAWSKAGVSRSVADSYARQLRGEFSWVRHALLHTCPPPKFWTDQFARLPKSRQIELLREVREEWIAGEKGQIAHFKKSHRVEHLWATSLRTMGFAAALGGWFLAMSLLWPAGEAHHPAGPAYPGHMIIIISSLLVIFGGLLISYSERQGHEELAGQYERMEILFRNGDKELADRLTRTDIAGAQRVIEELGREAITEHAGWYMLRRARSLELHIG
jgi:hypothetical protein